MSLALQVVETMIALKVFGMVNGKSAEAQYTSFTIPKYG
jgi:hypothetical protein